MTNPFHWKDRIDFLLSTINTSYNQLLYDGFVVWVDLLCDLSLLPSCSILILSVVIENHQLKESYLIDFFSTGFQ